MLKTAEHHSFTNYSVFSKSDKDLQGIPDNNRHVEIKPTDDEDRIDEYTRKELLNILKVASNRYIEIEDIRKT